MLVLENLFALTFWGCLIAGIVFKVKQSRIKKRPAPNFPNDFRQTDDDDRFIWICRHCRRPVSKTDIQCQHCSQLIFDRVPKEQHDKEMECKKLAKWMFIAVAVSLILFSGVNKANRESSGESDTTVSNNVITVQQDKTDNSSDSVPPQYATESQFNQITERMSYEKVSQIFGFSGVSQGTAEDGLQTLVWNGATEGSYAEVTFKNGFVVSKSAVGLSNGYNAGSDVSDASVSDAPTSRMDRLMQSAIYVDARTMFDDYQDNEVAADNSYKDKWIVTTIEVSGIDTNMVNDLPQVSHEFDFLEELIVQFRSDQKDKIAALSEGDTVTVLGKCTGELASYVYLKDAYLVD